jgi:hypothetical protein
LLKTATLPKQLIILKKSFELEPDNPENFQNLIQAFDASGDVNSAIGATQNAVEHLQLIHRLQDAENFKNQLQQLQSQRPGIR